MEYDIAISRVKSVVRFLAIAMVVFVLPLHLGISTNSQGAYKLEGVWNAGVTDHYWIPAPYPFQ